MGRKLIVDHGVITKIARQMGYSCNTVSLALMGKTKSDIAKQIRTVAKTEYRARQY